MGFDPIVPELDCFVRNPAWHKTEPTSERAPKFHNAPSIADPSGASSGSAGCRPIWVTIRVMRKNLARRVARFFLAPVMKYVLDTHVVVGGAGEIILGERVALANAILNVSSGNITLGNRTILSHGVMLITGTHNFIGGKRASYEEERDDGSWGGGDLEVPTSGFDVTIGEGVWIGAGAIILGGVKVGDHSIVGAGAVVTRSFPNHSVIVGVPGRRIGDTRYSEAA